MSRSRRGKKAGEDAERLLQEAFGVSEDQLLKDFILAQTEVKDSDNIAEIGIGLNPACMFNGDFEEEKKAKGNLPYRNGQRFLLRPAGTLHRTYRHGAVQPDHYL